MCVCVCVCVCVWCLCLRGFSDVHPPPRLQGARGTCQRVCASWHARALRAFLVLLSLVGAYASMHTHPGSLCVSAINGSVRHFCTGVACEHADETLKAFPPFHSCLPFPPGTHSTLSPSHPRLSHTPRLTQPPFFLSLVWAQFPVKVLSPREHELYKYMPAKVVVDTTRKIISPMPGQVVSLNVKPGDLVWTHPLFVC